jgi:hypothetical protein
MPIRKKNKRKFEKEKTLSVLKEKCKVTVKKN